MIWRKEFEIGIEEIDKQHKELFLRYNRLLQCLKKSKENEKLLEKIMETLEFLEEYVIYHFNSEERYQKEIAYPDIENHKRIHCKFKQSILDFKYKFSKNPDSRELMNAFCGYLLAWLINHVCDEDQQIYFFAHKKKVERNKEKLEKPVEIIVKTIKEVLSMISQIETETCERFDFENSETLTIKIEITGDYRKTLYFQFSNEFIVEAVKKMMISHFAEVDSFALASLKEIVNTIAGHSINNLQKLALVCNISVAELVDIKTIQAKEIICFNSADGKFKLFLD